MKTLNEYETIDKLKEGYSIARYGDGEISIIVKSKGVYLMQDFNVDLQNKLLMVLNSSLDNLLIGIPRTNEKIQSIKSRLWIPTLLGKIENILSSEQTFASSFISRPSIVGNNDIYYYDYIKSIWKHRNIVLVNFKEDIVNHYLYRDSNIEYIRIPKRNCFEQYDIILNRCRQFYSQDKVFLLSAGPAATCLSYDITREGEQCLDIGHITYEYESFVKGKLLREWASQG